MYCRNCGAEIREDAKFCPKCGTPAEQGKTAYNIQMKKSTGEQSVTKKKNHLSVKKAICFSVVIVIILVLIGVVKHNWESAENVAIKACETTIEGDMRAYYKLLAPSYQEYMVGSGGWYSNEEEFQADLLDYAEDLQNEIAGSCGADFKADFEVIGKRTCDEDDLIYVKRELQSYYDYDPEEINDAEVITVSIHAEGSLGEGSWTTEEACVKIENSWYLHRPGLDSL